jgi:MFS family permease
MRSLSAFGMLWAGQTVSLFGSQITALALPLTAVLALRAGPAQMGFLMACASAPWLLVGLVAGAWTDRLPRRRVLIATDVGRALLLATIPLAAWRGALGMDQLYAVAFLTGALAVFFDVAYQSFLPAVLPRERLVAGNSRLELSASVAQLSGPGLAGSLVQALAAPIAILLDAISFVISALFLHAIPDTEARLPSPVSRTGMRREIGEGVRAVLHDPVLRALAGSTATFNFFDRVLCAVYVLYMVRQLGIAPTGVGLIFALGAAGGLVSALFAGRIAARVGSGRALAAGIAVAALGEVIIVLAAGPRWRAVATLVVAEMLVECGGTLYGINAVSLRQATTPDHLLGRVNATTRVAGNGAEPLGALLGGALGVAIGLRSTLMVGALGTMLALVWIVRAVPGSRVPEPAH